MGKGQPRLATILLAAGRSQRMGEVNKLLIPIEGRPMIQLVVETIADAVSTDIYVVTGFEAERLEAGLADLDARFVFNERFQSGMGVSLAEGARAIADGDYIGAMALLGDLPYLKSDTVKLVAEIFFEHGGQRIVAPEFEGRQGHPVVFPKSCFGELANLTGDRGAKELIAARGRSVVRVEVDDPGVIRDVDTAGDDRLAPS